MINMCIVTSVFEIKVCKIGYVTKPEHDWNQWLGCWVPGMWGVVGSERAFGLGLVGDVSAK